METDNQLILAKSVNIFRRKSSSEQTKQSTQSESTPRRLTLTLPVICNAHARNKALHMNR